MHAHIKRKTQDFFAFLPPDTKFSSVFHLLYEFLSCICFLVWFMIILSIYSKLIKNNSCISFT